MFDAKRLLDQFIGTSSGARPPAQPGGQQQGGQAPGGQAQGGQGMDLTRMLEGKGGLATGAIAGGLATYLLAGKKPKKLAKNAVKYGGMAVIGGLAYKAWRDYQAGQSPQTTAAGAPAAIDPPPNDTRFIPQTPAEEDQLGRALLRAMIAAAKADGHIDAQEQRRIFEHVDKLELDNDDKAFVFEELSKPLDVDAVASAATSQEQAAEIYAASLLAIDSDSPAEKGYLSMLAARLQLPPEFVAHLHAGVEAASEPA